MFGHWISFFHIVSNTFPPYNFRINSGKHTGLVVVDCWTFLLIQNYSTADVINSCYNKNRNSKNSPGELTDAVLNTRPT